MNPSTVSSLANAYAARKDWYTNRASAIFPVRVRKGGDIVLAYLNYWSIKNKIENVQRVIRLYKESGELTHRQIEKVEGSCAVISVTDTFGLTGDFDGMIEIEFISVDNLRFAFPAVQAFYTDGNAISTVHSAGRSKNSDEARNSQSDSIETNWTCKFSANITPFFHVFTNGTPSGSVGIGVKVFSPSNVLLNAIDIPNLLEGSFSSRLMTLDSLFPELWSGAAKAHGTYCQVRVSQLGIFPRLVVGNLHRDSDFLEVTHSYAQNLADDFVISSKDNELTSFIPAIKPPGLDLRIVSFPTNSPSEVEAFVRTQHQTSSRLQHTDIKLSWRTGGENARVFNFTVPDLMSMVSFDLRGQKVPARLNVNYVYRVSGACSNYSTDISSAAAPSINPAKHTHWGTSVVGAGFTALLLARNIGHKAGGSEASKGSLTIWFDNDNVKTRSISIGAESSEIWAIEQADLPKSSDQPCYVHWLANFDQPTVEILWLSRADDGRICGDHSF